MTPPPLQSLDELQGLESSVAVPDQLRTKLRLPHHLSADSTPLMDRRSKEETVAIFDELLSQMEDTAHTFYPDDLNQASSSVETEIQNRNEAGDEFCSDSNVVEPGSGGRRDGERVAVMKRRVQSNDAPKGIVRPSSSASVNKEDESDAHPPRAASVETDLVFATLPKKKKKRGKWQGIKRIGSPLFRPRHKSFNHATPTSGQPPSNVHKLVTHPSPSVPIIPSTTPSQLAVDSRSSRSSLQNVTSLVDQVTREERKVGVAMGVVGGKRRGSSPRDECLNALKVMTTLSSNQECLGSLISYICLPKCVTK